MSNTVFLSKEQIVKYEKMRDEEFLPLANKANRTELEEARLARLRVIMAPYKIYLKKYFKDKFSIYKN